MPKATNSPIHIRKHTRNPRVLGTLTYSGDINIPTTVELIQYNEKQLVIKNLADPAKLKEEIDNNSVNWFKVTGIADVNVTSNICKIFGIQRFDIKDLLSSNQVTKVITYDHNSFVLMSGCLPSSTVSLKLEPIAFILGKNYVVSFQESKEPIFDDIEEAIKTSRIGIRQKSADYLLYILLNETHISFNDSLSRLTDSVNEMEDKLIDENINGINVMRFIQYRKKEYSMIKRVVSSLREEYVNLLHNTNSLIKEENKMYFNDFDDRLRTTLSNLEMFYITIESLTDLYFNNNNLQMNYVIKKLTIVSTIFIPLTFMVGVWGMNFDYMPELHWVHGYLFAWIVMAIIVVIALLYLKHKKWF